MKTSGLVRTLLRQAFALAILVAIGMALMSASTPLTHPEVARARSHGRTLPAPAGAAGDGLGLDGFLRRIGNRHGTRPFLLSVALFALGCLGLGMSMRPYWSRDS